MGARTTTRRQMVSAATELLSRKGFSGTTMRAVLERSGGPRGSVGFHFPGGRSELIHEALHDVGGQVESALADMESRGLAGADVFAEMCDLYADRLQSSDFVAGCPIGSAMAEIHADPEFAPQVGAILTSWNDVLARTLTRDGFSGDDAEELGMLAISALEGAILTSRMARSISPVESVKRRVAPLLKFGAAP